MLVLLFVNNKKCIFSFLVGYIDDASVFQLVGSTDAASMGTPGITIFGNKN
jgi:hypothetical protein